MSQLIYEEWKEIHPWNKFRGCSFTKECEGTAENKSPTKRQI